MTYNLKKKHTNHLFFVNPLMFSSTTNPTGSLVTTQATSAAPAQQATATGEAVTTNESLFEGEVERIWTPFKTPFPKGKTREKQLSMLTEEDIKDLRVTEMYYER